MRVDVSQSTAALRLVHPPPVSKPVEAALPPSAPVKPASDTFDFESVYVKKLPRIPVTDAQRKLERIRTELVAAQTATPIHFHSGARIQTNPFAPTFARFLPSPADVNTSATEIRAEQK